MIRNTLYLLLALPIIIVVGCSDGAGDAVALKLAPGKGLRMREWRLTEQTVTQQTQAGPQSVRQSVGVGAIYSVESVDSSGVTLMRITYDSVSFVQEGNGAPVAYSSADTSAPPEIALGWAAIVGQTFTVRIGPDGHVRQVTGLDIMLRNIIAKVADSYPGTRAMIEHSLRSLFSEKSMTETMERSLAIYPDKPVSVGDSWVRRTALSVGTPMTINTTYTLKKLEGEKGEVDLAADISTNSETGPIELVGMKISYAITGKQRGSMTVDTRNGWIMASTITQDVTGEMEIDLDSASAGVAKSRKVPVDMKSRTTTVSRRLD